MRLFDDLAKWWPVLSPAADYEEEAPELIGILESAGEAVPQSVLELGCGGGSMSFWLKRRFAMTLTDMSETMLEVSRKTNPECAHELVDMRDFDLGREFDAVLIHDAVQYLATREELAATFRNAARHLRPGGAVVLLPDRLPESFEAGVDSGGNDDPQTGRGLRFLEWATDPDPDDEQFEIEFAFMLRDADGTVTVEHDRHVLGLFDREVWLELLRDAGFTPRAFDDSFGRVVFVGVR